jgi:DNA-binding winged helix-turn-helix (wHTH) protein
MTAEQPPSTVRFGPFTFDRATRQLTFDDTPVHLTPKAFDLLSKLIDEAPRVVPKAELHSHLWPDSFVSDASLLGLIKEVRRALNDEGDGALIRTAHRVGYAFAAPLQRAAARPPRSAAWVMVGSVCVPLGEGENLIGRDTECTVRVDLPSISRRHARIVVDGVNAMIEDLGSKNGTSVGDQPATQPTALRDADQIQVGGVSLTFQVSLTNFPKATLPLP